MELTKLLKPLVSGRLNIPTAQPAGGFEILFERLMLDRLQFGFVGTKHLGLIESELLLGHAIDIFCARAGRRREETTRLLGDDRARATGEKGQALLER